MTRSHVKKEASSSKNHPKPKSSTITNTTSTSHGGRSFVSSTAGTSLLTGLSDAQSTLGSNDSISDHNISHGEARSYASKMAFPTSSTPKRTRDIDEPHRKEQRSRSKQELSTTSGVSRSFHKERDHTRLRFSSRAPVPTVSGSAPSTENLYPFRPTPTTPYGHHQSHHHYRDQDKPQQLEPQSARPWIGGNAESVTSETIATKSRVTSEAHGRYGM